MNRLLARARLLIATVLLSSAAPASADGHKEARLEERMAALSAAFNAADVPALETLLADHYSHTNNGGAPLDRAAWLESIEKRRADMDAGILEITGVETSDVEVRVSNDTAVGTGLYIMRGKRSGNDFGLRIRYTQVWEWDGEDWYRVAFHDTWGPIEESDTP